MWPHVELEIGNCQCAFQAGCKTVHKMFVFQQILEKTLKHHYVSHIYWLFNKSIIFDTFLTFSSGENTIVPKLLYFVLENFVYSLFIDNCRERNPKISYLCGKSGFSVTSLYFVFSKVNTFQNIYWKKQLYKRDR